MTKGNLFFRLLFANLKRLKTYIVSILIAVLILLTVCSVGGSYIAKSIYKPDVMSNIKIAYFLPDDDDKKYNEFGIGMMENMKSIKETIELSRVATIDEGYSLLEAEKILYFIIVPENFFTGIMYSDNYPLEIIVRDNTSISSYIANELFMSYASYLGIAQAGIYSAIDTMKNHEFSNDERYTIQDMVNLIYLDRALNKDSYCQTISYTDVGSLSLLDHYLASAVMLSILFSMFILSPMLQGYNNGIKKQFTANGINSIHLYVVNLIPILLSLYITFLPCFIGVSVIKKHINLKGLLTIIPTLFLMALIVSFINSISKNEFANNMLLFVVIILIAYIGGGILPNNLLPSIVQQISCYFPGEFFIKNIGHALFGI